MMSNLFFIKIITLASFFTIVFSTSAQDIKRDIKTNIAVFQFLNAGQQPNFEVLSFSLQEKLSNALYESKNFNVIPQDLINARITKRNLNIRENTDKPRIIQYICGLIQADMVVLSDYIVQSGDIIITTTVYESTEGQMIKSYRFKGGLNNIEAIIERIVLEITADTITLKDLGKLSSNNSIARHLGELVAQAEKITNNTDKKNNKTILKQTTASLNFNNFILDLLNIKIYICKFTLNQLYYLIGKPVSPNKSLIRTLFSKLFIYNGNKYRNTNITEAIKNWNNALFFIPGGETALLNIAALYAEQGLEHQAIENYKKCVENNPFSIQGYIGLAKAYVRQKQYSMAIQPAAKGLLIAPDIRDFYVVLSMAYAFDNNFEKAAKTAKSGLIRFPNDKDLSKLLYYSSKSIGDNYADNQKSINHNQNNLEEKNNY